MAGSVEKREYLLHTNMECTWENDEAIAVLYSNFVSEYLTKFYYESDRDVIKVEDDHGDVTSTKVEGPSITRDNLDAEDLCQENDININNNTLGNNIAESSSLSLNSPTEDMDEKVNKILKSLPPLRPSGGKPKTILLQRKVISTQPIRERYVVQTKKIPHSVTTKDVDLHCRFILPKSKQDNDNVNNSQDSSSIVQTDAPSRSVVIGGKDIGNSSTGDHNYSLRPPPLQLHQNIFHCGYCKASFNKPTLLTQHVHRHLIVSKSTSDLGPGKCNICGKEFGSNLDLEKHKQIHNKEKSHQCQHCKKKFTLRGGLSRHMQRHHTHDMPHKCQYCTKSCISNAELVAHLRTHTKEKPYECEYCQKCFSTKSNLKIHIRRHKKEKPYTCCICSKSFTNKCDLVDHTRTHTKEKPYKCKVCEKAFSQKSNLKTHERKHHAEGDRPHKCEHCGKSFLFISQLSIHVMRHKEVQQYKCDHCKKFFLDEAVLKRHSETEHQFKEVVLCS